MTGQEDTKDNRLAKVEAHLYTALNDGNLDDLAHEHVGRAYRLLDGVDEADDVEEPPEDGETWYREDCVHGSLTAHDLYPREEIEERVREHAHERNKALLETYGIEPDDLEIRWCTFEDGVLIYKLTHEDIPPIEHEYIPNPGPNTQEVTR